MNWKFRPNRKVLWGTITIGFILTFVLDDFMQAIRNGEMISQVYAQSKRSSSQKKLRPQNSSRENVSKPKRTKNEKLLDIINEELRTLKTRFPKAIKTDPNMMFRVSELYFEKAKILQQVENNRFLRLSAKKRASMKKEDFFKNSRLYLKAAEAKGRQTLKLTNNPDLTSEIYIILAYNAKEFNEDEAGKKFFLLALKQSRPGTQLRRKAQVGLAEYLYNDRKYDQAIALYRKALKFKKYRWWTKDSFNLAWCYFQKKDYDSAINLMRDIYFKSAMPQYIDISERALSTISLFYAQSKRIQPAIKFFRSIGKNLTKHLIEMARTLMLKQNFATAEEVLKQALKFGKNREEKIDSRVMMLRVYEKFGKLSRHLRICQELFAIHMKKPITGQNLIEFQYHLQNMGAHLQKQVVGTMFRGVPETRVRRARLAARYFQMLSKVKREEEMKYKFLEGETYYTVGLYNQAMGVYYSTLKLCIKFQRTPKSKIKCNKTDADKYITSALSTLGNEGLNKKILSKFLVPTYETILILDPKSKRSQKIYQKLFSGNIEKRDIFRAERVIKAYKINYPSDLATQETMVAKIMDIYLKQNNIKQLLVWAKKIHNREYLVGRSYEIKLHQNLASIQFNAIQNELKKGNKKQALAGYVKIYNYKLSPPDARKKSAYNIALLYLELGWMKDTLKWTQKSLGAFSQKEVLQYVDTYLQVMNELFQRRQLRASAIISDKLIAELCTSKFDRKEMLLKNSASLYFAEGDYFKARQSFQWQQKCGLPDKIVDRLKFEFLENFKTIGNESEMEKLIYELGEKTENRPKLLKHLFGLYQKYEFINQGKAENYRSKLFEYMNTARAAGIPLPKESMDYIVYFEIPQLEIEVQKLNAMVLSYPQEKFNKVLQQKLQQLEFITDLGLKILKKASGIANVKVYKILIMAYERMAEEVSTFLPAEVPKEYIQAFKESMASLAGPLGDKASEFFGVAKNLIKKGKIFSEENFWFLSKGLYPVVPAYEYQNTDIVMDRRGQ